MATRSKASAQRMHAKRRAYERYGVSLNRTVYHQLVQKIIHQDAQFLKRQSLRVTLHRVEHDGIEYTVAYDKLRKTIITCLPRKEG